MTWSPAFSRAFGGWLVFSSRGFLGVFPFLFGFTALNRKSVNKVLTVSYPVSLIQSPFFSMRAPETIPLVMEPESRFYSDPVLVLDFQSLYPSMVIAYNYCFSTCLGRVSCLSE